MKWYMHACPICGGDLHDADERGWLECLMCARAFRSTDILSEVPRPAVAASAPKPQFAPAPAASRRSSQRQAA